MATKRPGIRKSMLRQSLLLSKEQIEDMTKVFDCLDNDGNGSIDLKELGKALEVVGIKVPGYELREMVSMCDTKDRDDVIDLEEFKDLYTQLKIKYDFKGQMQKLISPIKEEVVVKKKDELIIHTMRVEEQMAFTNWMSMNFADDPDCSRYFPFEADGSDLYKKCQDGILYIKLINLAQPGTIHEQAINKPGKQPNLSVFQCHENLTLAIRSAQSIGCTVVNIGPDDLHEGREHLVLGLVWQVIRIGLLSAINLVHHKELVALLEEGETLEEFMRLSPEQILIRWVNYHLQRSQCGRVVTNFSSDIKDSVAYIHLINQIAPADAGVTTTGLMTNDHTARAELMLKEADKLKCRVFVTPKEVVKGNYNLNLAFVAYMFNRYPALEVADIEPVEVIEETREERTYRNWMNSLGVKPRVNHLYTDLIDGLVIFQLYDIIRPGMVEWKRVVKEFNTRRIVMEMIGNCNYCVELGQKCKFSLVGIAGKDLYDGNKTYILALLWQLMKAYTLSLLNKLRNLDPSNVSADADIISWANNKLAETGKSTKINGFSDRTISSGRVIIDLIDAIRPNSIKYDIVLAGDTDEEKLSNAKYAISVAWRHGARIYALPEDIAEVKNKMVMTIFACLMILDLENKD